MKLITRSEKEKFSGLMAAIFAPPDKALFADLAQAHSLFPQAGEIPLEALQREYDRLFSNWRRESISLIESTYKTWTLDQDCGLPFAGKKGAIMGDCALHLQSIFQALFLEIPADFRGTPDHLILELELLSYFYRSGSEVQIQNFIEDHLDWIPELKRQILETAPDSFYRHVVERLSDFLDGERISSKEQTNGPTGIH